MKIAVVIQARMSSSRVPGKVIMEVEGKPILLYLLDRLNLADLGLPIIVATSKEDVDQQIFDFCSQYGVECYRGSHLNVVSRFIDIINSYSLDALVRISADSPLIDGFLIKKFIKKMDRNLDLLTNVFPRSYPKGQSVEILKAESLKANYARMVSDSDREHVTQFFYRNDKEFKILNNLSEEESLSEMSMAIDTKDDLDCFKLLVQTYGESLLKLNCYQLAELYSEINKKLNHL